MAISYLRACGVLVRTWFVLILFLTPATARANIGPPWSGGSLAGEPVGVEGVAITRETLTIDLRPLADNGLAQVEAIYHVQNHGSARKLDLLFASGSAHVADFQVWLGSQPLASAPAKEAKLPASWQVPRQTPGLHHEGSGDLVYQPRQVTPVAFTVTIPPGPHDLIVRYTAEAATHRHGHPTVYRQFAYVLAPARAWSGFGGLDVTIHLPAHWRVACTPALTHEGDTLTGSFADLPADALALTLQASEGWAYWPLTYASLGLFGLAALGGAAVCWRGGRSRGRRLCILAESSPHGSGRHAWPMSVGLGMAWGLAMLGTGWLAIASPDWVLPDGQANHYGYGQAFAMLGVICLSILALPFGFMIAQLTAIIEHRRPRVSNTWSATESDRAGHSTDTGSNKT